MQNCVKSGKFCIFVFPFNFLPFDNKTQTISKFRGTKDVKGEKDKEKKSFVLTNLK